MTSTGAVAVWGCACGWRGTWYRSDRNAPAGGETVGPVTTGTHALNDTQVGRMGRPMPDRCPTCGRCARYTGDACGLDKLAQVRRVGQARARGQGTDDGWPE